VSSLRRQLTLGRSGVAALARREHQYREQRFSDRAALLTIDYDFKP